MKNLFSEDNKKEFLGVIYNDEPYNKSIDELFDTKTFDTIHICTFVSSNRYFFTQTSNFKNIELLLGIEDSSNAQKFMLDLKYMSEFLKSLPEDAVEKIINRQIDIRYTQTSQTIHSKIYILTNSTTKHRRVIVGSANYSSRAFSNSGQFEELIAYDSDYNYKFVEHFVKRYEHIKAFTLDFIPRHTINKIKKGELNILTLGDNEILDILKNKLSQVQTAVILPDELSSNIEKTKKLMLQQEESLQKELQSIIQTQAIIEIVTKSTKGVESFIKAPQFEKNKEQIITKILKPTTITKEFVDSRVELIYSKMDSQIFIGDSSSSQTLTPYAKEASDEMIVGKLEMLDRFISAYDIYTINKDASNKKRIFESILYAFSSIYMWRFREMAAIQQGRDEVKSGFPIFMLIAGMSQSGKTHLIKFISQIMGNHGSYYHYSKNAKLSAMNEINPQIISQFFYNENLTPILVDEIVKDYFSSNSSAPSGYMGEGFIKKITNAKDDRHPCMIASSNTDFSANSQVMRRIYYIQLNNPFDSTKKVEMAEYFTNLLNEFGTELYRDFLYRLEKKLNAGLQIDINDILKPSRDIFKEYYQMLNIPIPSYFSSDRIDDYYIRGKDMWKNLYQLKYMGFKEHKNDNIILLDDETVFGAKMSANRDKKEMLQFLPIGVLIEEKGIVKLNYKNFFEFIDEKSRNSGILKRMFL